MSLRDPNVANKKQPRRVAIVIDTPGRDSVLGRTVNPADAEQIQGPWVALASIVVIGVGLAIWEAARLRSRGVRMEDRR